MPTRRNSNRVPQHDYSTPGHYFVTILTNNRDEILGIIKDDRIILNKCGEIVNACILNISTKYPNVELDLFVIMPNHVHAIINIVGAIHESPDNKSSINNISKYNDKIKHIDNSIRAIHELPLQYNRRIMTLSKIIGYLKMQTAKQINILKNTPEKPLWQRNYYDHVIRNDKSLNRIREYIINNPATWDNDIENPNRIGNIKSELINI